MVNRFRDARIKAGLSQKAAALSVGVKPPSMSDWENGKAQPSNDHLVAMAALYNVSVDYLLGHAPDTKKEPSVSDAELRDGIISRLHDLPDPALVRVSDFLDGLEAGREIWPAAAADPGSDAAPAQPGQ